MSVAFMGPWYGELGWELLTWQAYCRHRAKEFDKVYVSSFPDMKALYEDFATFIPHAHPVRALDWHDLSCVAYTIPPDADVHIKPHKQYKVPNQTFIKFNTLPIAKYDYLMHPRNIRKGGNKNYPKEDWEQLVPLLPGSVAVIGTKEDLSLPGATDLRGIPLPLLMQYIAGSKVVIGQSSGVMHLATLCNTPIVVWGDSKTYFGETLEKRYKETWNPFKSPVEFLFDDHWHPEVDDIVTAVRKFGGEEFKMKEEYKEEIFTPNDEENVTEVVNMGGPVLVGEPEYLVPETETAPTPEAMEKIMRHLHEQRTVPGAIPQIPEEKTDNTEGGLPVDENMSRALQSAASSGKWFLMVSYVDPTDKSRFLHTWQCKDFPTEDLTKVLDHIKTEVAEKVVNKNIPKFWR